MKKVKLLLVSIFSLLLSSGCTIDYTIYNEEKEQEAIEEEASQNESSIPEDALFYPSTLNKTSEVVTKYSYIDSNLTAQYDIHSAYYSATYDVLYISYEKTSESNQGSPLSYESNQTLTAKNLAEIEKHILSYFESDSNKSEYRDYIKAIRIYPDRLASSCRNGQSDDVANQINGCADYGGKEATIDLNNVKSLSDFYNPKTTLTTYTEPMRDTLAHEYGHIATYYHMAYKNDEDYEDYLKLRLGSSYNTIYPSGLPAIYDSGSSYYIQPEEILADDYVELFYNTSSKKETDTFDYELNYQDLRNSLTGYESVKFLKDSKNSTLYNTVRQYYKNNFLKYENKQTYTKPIVISKSSRLISYYESYTDVGKTSELKSLNSSINVNLIAVGETTVNNEKYYRVILSNTFNLINGSYDKKEIGKKMGYVKASEYTLNNSIKIYKIDHSNDNALSSSSILPIERIANTYVLPFYDFSYVLNTSSSTNYATMYDYLNNNITGQTYQINIYSFGTEVISNGSLI